MKALKLLKVAVVSLLLFFITTASATTFMLKGDNYIIDERVQQKITEIGNELKTKTNVSVYVYIKNSYGLQKEMPMVEKFKNIKKKELELQNSLQKPYVLLTMSMEDIHVNLLTSQDLQSIIDKDDVLNGYVIPLLASKDKNELYAKASAAVLNGYGQIADVVSKHNNIKLETNIGNQGKVTGTIWKVFMYTIIVGGILLYTYAVMRRRK